ncbi:MAG: glycosyltransferase 87 family protein [Acidobacteriota bacterium]
MPEPQRNAPRLPLAVLGAVSLLGYVFASLGLAGSGSAEDIRYFLTLFAGLFALYFLALSWARRGAITGARSLVPQILMWAALFRLAMLPAGLPQDSWPRDLLADLRSQEVTYRSHLLYDNDVWRYLWDGHVLSHGLNPYATSPAEFEARLDDEEPIAVDLFEDELWQDVFDRVSYGTYHTVYPPAAQGLFALSHLLAPGSILLWKLILVVLDLATCYLLVRLSRSRGLTPSSVLLYAWNPLLIKEIAGSGHLDAAMIYFLVLAVYGVEFGRPRLGLFAFGMATLSKITPILLLPLFLVRSRPRHWWVLGVTLAVGYLPFAGALDTMVRAILAFAREWVFNPGPWLLIYRTAEATGLPGRVIASLIGLAVTLGLIAWAVRSDDRSNAHLTSSAFAILGGYLIFGAAVMPWYLLWVLPFAALSLPPDGRLSRRPWVIAWTALTGLSLLSYQIYVDQVEHRWWLWVEYLGFFGIFAAAYAYCRSARLRSAALQNADA